MLRWRAEFVEFIHNLYLDKCVLLLRMLFQYRSNSVLLKITLWQLELLDMFLIVIQNFIML
jgi:hypothetical protein